MGSLSAHWKGYEEAPGRAGSGLKGILVCSGDKLLSPCCLERFRPVSALPATSFGEEQAMGSGQQSWFGADATFFLWSIRLGRKQPAALDLHGVFF